MKIPFYLGLCLAMIWPSNILSQTPLVPAWSLGHIIWEDSINTEQGAQRLCSEYAAHRIPVDGIIIDSPWSEAYNDFNWDRQRYPHAEQMLSNFKQQGVKVILWLTGCVNTAGKDTPRQKAANYDEAERLRYGINDNTPSRWWKGNGLQIDFTNPSAREWWFAQLDKVFTDGVYGFKVDQGEVYFGDTVRTSAGTMSNREFRKYYYDAIFDYVRMRSSEAITIARPYSHQRGFHATPEKMIIGWCGDFGGDWSGLKLQIDNVYRSAEAGYGAVGCEVAGFMGAKATRLDFIRYAQFGAMTACMINGGENGAFSSHLPWFHGEDVSDIYRQCVVLHNQLRPYLFSVLVDSHLHGGGLLRQTSIEEESHLLGEDIFTKAITNPEGQATFRLPAGGEWVDYFSGKSYPGGTQLSMTYPLDRFPLFIRKGAIIPMSMDGNITYLVCPGGTTTRKLYLPSGEGVGYEECVVTFSETNKQLEVNGIKHLQYKVIGSSEGISRQKYSEAVAKSFTYRFADPDVIRWGRDPNHFCWQAGYIMLAMEKLWRQTGDQLYLKYIQRYVDQNVRADGSIPLFSPNALDNFLPGYACLLMYELTGERRYAQAAETIRRGFDNYPRNKYGIFYHSKRIPQLWVDGVFMGQMFLARYAKTMGHPEDFAEIVRQMQGLVKLCGRPDGLLYHCWAEQGKAPWADDGDFHSPEVWSEGLGWAAVLFAEVFDYLPENQEGRNELLDALRRMCQGLKNCQDAATGMWCQVVDKPLAEGNWNETSGTGMFIYLIQSAINKGYIPASEYQPIVQRAYEGIVKKTVKNEDGAYNLLDCSSIGVKNSYEEYISSPREISTYAAFGSFILGTGIMEH